jgi:LmbE family N-acetylglucosaminyl deacetylase
MISTERRVCLSLLAHPDDAEICCGGTLVRLAREQGYEVHIATMTPGDCGSSDLNRWEISRVRTAEARAAAAMIGATYHCLDERDGMVFYERGANQKVIDLFRSVCPTLVFTHPRQDYMLDHEQTHLLARSASFVFSVPNISTVPLRDTASIPHLYYCDPLGGKGPLGEDVMPTNLIDVFAAHNVKLKMLACHASQREWLRAHHGIDEYLNAVERHDAERGRLIGGPFAEGFIQHRGHAYPTSDLLSELFPPVKEAH